MIDTTRRALAVLALLAALAPASAWAQPTTRESTLDGPWTEAETPERRILPSQVKVAYMLLHDLEGNRNRTVDDGAAAHLSTAEEWRALDAFEKKKLAEWGVSSVTNLKASDFPSRAKYAFFCIEKALFLDQQGWKPSQVTDDFLDVSQAKVRGQSLADSRVFVQTIHPAEGVASNGIVYAGLPGYNNTHIHMYDVASQLVKKGSTVVLGDQDWAGLDTGKDVHKGGVPSGEAISATMYAVAAKAHADHPAEHLVVIGHSLGGGLGVWGMTYLNERGELSLRITDRSGRSIQGSDLVPRGTPGAPLSAFLDDTPNAADIAIRIAGKIPGFSLLELPDWLTAGGNRNLNQLKAILEGTYDQPESMDAVMRLASEIVRAVVSGEGPRNLMVAFHSYEDTLARFSTILDMHRARAEAGLPGDLTVAPGDVHNVLTDVELAHQAADAVHERVSAWFRGAGVELGLRVAPVVSGDQNPAPSFLGRIGSALGGLLKTVERSLGFGRPSDADRALAGQVKEQLDAAGRPSRTAGALGALLRARVGEATRPEEKTTER